MKTLCLLMQRFFSLFLIFIITSCTASRSPKFQDWKPATAITEEDFSKIFPSSKVHSFEPLDGGYSGANIYKVKANGKNYVLRRSAGVFGPKGVSQEFAIQEKMAELGISPKVFYSEPSTGLIAMEYVDNKLQNGMSPEILKSIPKAFEELMGLLRKIHATKEFRYKLGESRALDYVKRAYKEIPKGFLKEKEERLLARIINTKWPLGIKTLTHNDFRSSNLLHDGERFWVIDWEQAAIGHPFSDIAFFANLQAMSPNEGEALFKMYLERPFTKQELDDFKALRRINFAFGVATLPRLAKQELDVRLPREGEVELTSLKDAYLAIDRGNFDLNVGRDMYRLCILMIRASEDY